jgi:polar amino acid transport system substrate-binding protein
MTVRLLMALAFASLATISVADAAPVDVLKELAPTGTLRVGVAYAPAGTPLFAVKDASGEVHGVPRMIGDALGKSLGVPVAITAVATTNELTEACAAGTIDIGFMPIDAERRQVVDFSPPYFEIESTYLVSVASGIKSLKEIDRHDMTVVGISGSTTIRAAGRNLTVAKLVSAPSIADAMAMMKDGRAQAIALTHDSLPPLQRELPGSRILDGAFQITGVAIALHKDHPAALATVTAFVETAKHDGTLRRIFDAAGLQGLAVAP